MNWTMFFAVLFGVPIGMALMFGLVSLGIWMDETLGGCWGGVLVFGFLVIALATLLGWASK